MQLEATAGSTTHDSIIHLTMNPVTVRHIESECQADNCDVYDWLARPRLTIEIDLQAIDVRQAISTNSQKS